MLPDPKLIVDAPRAVPADSAARWWWDGVSLLFRASGPLVLIALSLALMDVGVGWLARKLPEAQIGLLMLSCASAPLWMSAVIVALRWGDLGTAALKVSMFRVQIMAGRLYYLMIPVGVAAFLLLERTPDGHVSWRYASMTWALLVMVSFMAWPNLVSSAILTAYHDKTPQAAKAGASQGWRMNGWVSLCTSALIAFLAFCGAASTLPNVVSTFSSAFTVLILVSVLYAGYVDVHEKRRPGSRDFCPQD